MRNCIRFLPVFVLLSGCEKEQPLKQASAPEPWSNEAEVVFQTAEVLRYSVEQQKLELSRMKEIGIEGRLPASR